VRPPAERLLRHQLDAPVLRATVLGCVAGDRGEVRDAKGAESARSNTGPSGSLLDGNQQTDVPTLPMPDFIALDVQLEAEMPARDICIELKRAAPRSDALAGGISVVVRSLAARLAALIRVDAIWLSCTFVSTTPSARGDVAEVGVEQVVAAHGRESRFDGALLGALHAGQGNVRSPAKWTAA
jgi:hypothetical protein